MSDSSETHDDGSRRSVRVAVLATVCVVVAGFAALPLARTRDYAEYSLFYSQFAAIEPLPLAITLVFAIAVYVAARGSRQARSESLPEWKLSGGGVLVLAAAVGLIVVAGTQWAFGRFMVADDEFAAWFQAVIYAHGRTSGSVPAAWCPNIAALVPDSIVMSGCSWKLSFLPLHSLYTSLFVRLGIGHFEGALSAALSVILVWSIARKVWPEHPRRAALSAAFFAASTQMLFMSMTMFSMSTHLLVALVWLWLYVDDRRWSLLLLPWVGVIAIGVHSPFPHALLIPVFLFRWLRQRRFGWLAYAGAVYCVGLSFWLAYINNVGHASGPVLASATSTAGVAGSIFLHWPTHTAPVRLAIGMHAALVATWNSPVLLLLVFLAALRWRRLDAFSRDAALTAVFMFAVRAIFFATSQGAGWGYRYMHDALGLLAMLAAVGAEELASAVGARRATALLATSFAVVCAVQLPMRVMNVRATIKPFRDGEAWMQSLHADVVVYPWQFVRFGRQYLWNDPFLRNRPILIGGPDVTTEQLRRIRDGRFGTVRVLSRDEVLLHGFPATEWVGAGIRTGP